MFLRYYYKIKNTFCSIFKETEWFPHPGAPRFYLFLERESEQEQGGGTEGERDSQADSALSAEPSSGLDLTTPDETKSRSPNRLHHPGALRMRNF